MGNDRIEQLEQKIRERQDQIPQIKADDRQNSTSELVKSTNGITLLDQVLLAIKTEANLKKELQDTHPNLTHEMWLDYSIIPDGEKIDEQTAQLANQVFLIIREKCDKVLDGVKDNTGELKINIPSALGRRLTILYYHRPKKNDRVRISMMTNGSIELHISSTDRVSGTYQRTISDPTDLAHILTRDQLKQIVQNPKIIYYLMLKDCQGFIKNYLQIKAKPVFKP